MGEKEEEKDVKSEQPEQAGPDAAQEEQADAQKDREESSKLKRLVELHAMRNRLADRANHLYNKRSTERIVNGIEGLFQGLNDRAAKAFQRRDAYVQGKENLRKSLETLNTTYDTEIQEIEKGIEDLEAKKIQLLASQKLAAKITRKMAKKLDKDSPLLAKYNEVSSQAKEEYYAVLRQIAEKKQLLKNKREEREGKINELTAQEAALVKPSLFTRIFGRFGFGAQQRADALAARITERTESTNKAIETVEQEYIQTSKDISATREAIREEVKDRIQSVGHAVIGIGKSIAGFGENIAKKVEAVFDVVSTAPRYALRQVIAKVVAFSVNQEQDKATIDAAKKQLGMNGKEDKSASAVEM